MKPRPYPNEAMDLLGFTPLRPDFAVLRRSWLNRRNLAASIIVKNRAAVKITIANPADEL